MMDNHLLAKRLEELSNGDKSAFQEIYSELKTPVYTIIYRILYDGTLSEDVMQDVFLRLLKSPPIPHVKNPRAWIFQMARNLAIDCKRGRKEEEALSDEMESKGPSLEDAVCTKLDVELALSHLTLEEREIVTLHLNAGLRFREVAKALNKPLGTVLWRYQKAIQSLRRHSNGGV